MLPGSRVPVLRRVRYRRQELQLFINDWFAIFTDVIALMGNPMPDDYTRKFHQIIAECMVSFKHPYFAAENEWRLVDVYEHADLDVAAYPLCEKPHISLAAEFGKLPITSVVIGPGLDFGAAQPAVRKYLLEFGYDAPVLPPEARLRA